MKIVSQFIFLINLEIFYSFKHGLFEASEFKDVLEEKYFDYYNVKYLKISIGKGIMPYQDIMRYIEEELYGLIHSGEAPIH